MTRVVQWATGSIGRVCLRYVIDHPDLERDALQLKLIESARHRIA